MVAVVVGRAVLVVALLVFVFVAVLGVVVLAVLMFLVAVGIVKVVVHYGVRGLPCTNLRISNKYKL